MNDSLTAALESSLSSIPRETLERGVLISCSGGPDSMALLHAMAEWNVNGYTLEAVTMDHGLRQTSREETAMVTRECEKLRIPCHLRTISTPDSREEIMRSFRREICLNLIQSRNLGVIATGHHLADQAETLLMRLIRGSGLQGLRAMELFRAPWLKPLLYVDRVMILAFLHERNIPFAEDPSNQETDYFRNRVRHQILPLLAAENPRILHTLADVTRNLAEEYGALMEIVAGLMPEPAPFEDGVLFPLLLFREHSPGLVAHFIRVIHSRTPPQVMLERKHVEEARDFLARRHHGQMPLPGNMSIEIIGDSVYFGPPLATPQLRVQVPGPRVPFVSSRGEGVLEPSPHGDIFIPPQAWPLTLRFKEPGDRLSRKGMGSVRLQKIYDHVPHRIKERLVVIESVSGELLWAERAGRAFGI
ncbi:tRNA lysidine(34) synthetase TilS, partial [Myxococcota bacterium]|nr:tRNA lysidine(34) synthetase TilS [Myxococcota bacterium]